MNSLYCRLCFNSLIHLFIYLKSDLSFLPWMKLKTTEDEHLNNSLGDAGLISPDKEDISRILVE